MLEVWPGISRLGDATNKHCKPRGNRTGSPRGLRAVWKINGHARWYCVEPVLGSPSSCSGPRSRTGVLDLFFEHSPAVSLLLNLRYHFNCSVAPLILLSFPIAYSIMAAPTPRAAFEAVFPSLREAMLDHAKKYNLPENALEWFSKVLQYPNWPLYKTLIILLLYRTSTRTSLVASSTAASPFLILAWHF